LANRIVDVAGKAKGSHDRTPTRMWVGPMTTVATTPTRINDLFACNPAGQQAKPEAATAARCAWLVIAARDVRDQTFGMDAKPSVVRRLICRLNLWHRWHTAQNDDGEPFVECRDCKKEGQGRPNWAGGGPF
jgi:hypothetical protein